MLSTRWYKVLRDLWANKTRTILVVLSIAVGVFAVGMIGGSNEIMSNDLNESYATANPASATLYVEPFDDELVQTVRGMREIGEAEGRSSTSVRVKVGTDQWRKVDLFAIADYDNIRVNKFSPESGTWPPAKGEVLLERTSLTFLNLKIGDTLVVETSTGKQRELRVAGTVHDLNLPPSNFMGQGFGYVNFDTMETLGQPNSLNQLNILVAQNALDKKHVQEVVNKVRDKVQKGGKTVNSAWVPDPGVHPMSSALQAFSLLLDAMGLLSLLLSGFLVINTINALLAQQVRQIGVMKAVGARQGQVVGIYLATVMLFGLLALAIGVPLGWLGARTMGAYTAGLMNIDVASIDLNPQVAMIQVAVGLFVPLLAAAYPILSGTRVSVREAISDYGVGNGQYGNGLIDHLLGRVRGVPRPLLLSVRNTFRRKGRLLLTLATLTLAGAVFISVFSVNDSALSSLDEAFQYFNFDVEVGFNRTYRVEQVEQVAMSVPDVLRVESLRITNARRMRDDGSDGVNTPVFAPSPGTNMIQPTLLQGRWLLPEDENALVINTDVLKEEPDIKVGDEIVLKIGDRESTWKVVGLVKGVMSGRMAFTNFDYLNLVTRDVGHAGRLWVQTKSHGDAYQAQVAKSLEEAFKSNRVQVSSAMTTGNSRKTSESNFLILVVFLLIMAALMAVVGGLGLMGTMSLNVLERRREIGVMRAVGAPNGAIRQIVLLEGIAIGVLSWLVGVVVSLPLGKPLSDSIGTAFAGAPLNYTFSTTGTLIWLGAVVIISTLACLAPTISATRLSVREVLAYE